MTERVGIVPYGPEHVVKLLQSLDVRHLPFAIT